MLLRHFIALTISLFCFSSLFAQTASIKGNVFDGVSRDGLAGAYISIPNTAVKKVADDKGNFELKNLAAGEYDLTITNVGYATIHRHITLKEGQTLQLFIGLTPEGKAMDEVTVFGQADREKESGARNKERNAANISNVISSQAMVRSPDINAANVLQRVSGVTIQRSTGGDEAYAIIRGMEPRYNNTLLNGVKIASPDPKNRYVQLDIIPADILSSIEISKSLTPDMEGDATGGTVNMVVKDAPDKTSFKATASVGYSQLYFDQKYIDFQKSAIQRLSPVQRNPPGYIAQPNDFSRSNLDFRSRQAPPTTLAGFSFTHRYLHDKLGFVLADNLQNQYYGSISFAASTTPGNDTTGHLQATNSNNYKQYTQQMNNGLVAHLDYVINERNKINLDNFYLISYLAQTRMNVDTTLIGNGRVGPGTGQIFGSQLSQTQHQYIEHVKLSGQHVLSPELKLDWAGVFSDASNRQPDVAVISTDWLIKPDFTRTGTYYDNILRIWQNNNDQQYSGLVNLDFHKKFNANDLEIKAGGLYRRLSRQNTEDDYNLKPTATNSSGGANSKPAWTNIYDAQWDVYNTTGTSFNPNDYKASETVYAGYGMFRLKTPIWEVGGGLRVENTNATWDIRVHSPTAPSFGGQTYQDFLPDAFMKYNLTHRANLHLSYYRSIARPNYYELIPVFPTNATTADVALYGNPYVQHSVADNFDLRYEWFPKGEQHLFVGVFYKHINNPIEYRVDTTSQSGSSIGNSGLVVEQPLNSNPATNMGAELSFTQYFGKLFGITGNYTYTHSAISAPQLTYQRKTVTPTRPMQGQSEHIANLSLLYKDTKHGAFAQLSYQYIGTTLAFTGAFAGSDYYQRPMNSLAFSAEKDIHKHFTVFGKFSNLLNTPVKQYVQNVILVRQNTFRATYNIGIRYEY